MEIMTKIANEIFANGMTLATAELVIDRPDLPKWTADVAWATIDKAVNDDIIANA